MGYEDAILTAKWKAYGYTVHFDGNGATSGEMSDQSFDFGVEQCLKKNAFTRKGYKFTGWADEDGNTYTDEQNVKDFTTVNDEVVVLYAQWEPINYKVHFDGNGATSGEMEDQDFVYDVSQNLTKNYFARTGYTFTGWADEAGKTNTDEQLVKNLTSEDGDVVTLTAIWSINGYELTVIPNGGEWDHSTENQSFSMDCNSTKLIPDPIRTGYTFTGWSLIGAGSTFVEDTKIFTMGYENATLTAQWSSEESFIVTYHGNGGKTSDGQSVYYSGSYSAGTNIISENNMFYRDGYVFVGWYDGQGDDAKSYGEKVTVTQNLDLYAHWVNIFNIKVDNKDPYKTYGETGVSSSGFDLIGAQIRYNRDDGKNGLRFVSRISKEIIRELDALDGVDGNVKYGHYLCTGLTENDTLDDKNGTKLEATNNLYNGNMYCTFSAVVINIPEASVNTEVFARPYIEYTDANGVVRTHLFTETEARNYNGAYHTTIARVAKYIVDNDYERLSNSYEDLQEYIKSLAAKCNDD